MDYDFEIQYKLDSTNSASDALSRLPENIHVSQLLIDFKDLSAQVTIDPFLSNIVQSLQQNPNSYPNFKIEGAHLRYKGRLVLPFDSPYIPLLLHEFHHGSIGGHARIRRTYARLATKFYWKGIKKHVQDYVNACDVCQRSKYEAMVPTSLLQPLPI